ncbi:MAG: ATP-binding cassette domain-containing protein [Phycisphaerales bacterium]|nr:ATP-binding cassette domain-containing protein [Phycisphaerales bacterium]
MILVREIRKSYGRIHALGGVSFAVERGEIVGLLGPNGAGKSTTIRILTGFLTPDAGSVQIDGHDAVSDSSEARRRIGYLPESAPLYPEMSVSSYLDYRGRLYGLARAERRRAGAEAMARCRIEDMARRRIGHLSKGYRQRVGLASALLHNPPVLVLDEPSNGLDPSQIRETRSLVRELGESRTMIVSSHVLPEVERLATRIIVIAGGMIRADGTLSSLLRGGGEARFVAEVEGPGDEYLANIRALPGVRAVRAEPLEGGGWSRIVVVAGEGSADPRPMMSRHAAYLRLPLRELRREEATLEQVFLGLADADRPGTTAVPA